MSSILENLEQRIGAALARIERLEQVHSEGRAVGGWDYLVQRPHPWRRQLWLKGRNMTVGQFIGVVQANGLTPEAAAADFDLPITAVHEAITYSEEHRELLALEAAEERRRLVEQGYQLEPSTSRNCIESS